MRLRRALVIGLSAFLAPGVAASQVPRPEPPPADPPEQPAGQPSAAPGAAFEPKRPSLPPRVGLRTGPQLSIVELRRVDGGRIRVGSRIPVELTVRNSGDAAATVRAVSRDLSQGSARFAFGPEARVPPGEKAVLRLDLFAQGSGVSFDGRERGALCGERSERKIFLEELLPTPLPGYRPGNDAVATVRTFHDANDADHERTVSFRFDCEVTFQR